jgi:hypothetical protein
MTNKIIAETEAPLLKSPLLIDVDRGKGPPRGALPTINLKPQKSSPQGRQAVNKTSCTPSSSSSSTLLFLLVLHTVTSNRQYARALTFEKFFVLFDFF